MSSSMLVMELGQLCSELCSEKTTIRNKSVDKLDNILNNSKNDLIVLYRGSTSTVDPSWGRIFNCSVDAVLLHAEKVKEAEGSKGFQALRNRNYIYSSIINKLIDYSLEDNNNFLTKSNVLTAFFNGFSNRTVVKNFGKLFLQILERGVYESVENTQDLKVNELSRILSFLFEINIINDEHLKLSVIRCINKTLELCQKYVQLGYDLKDYFDEVKSFATEARDEGQQTEVIKMFYLFTSELSVDYHISVCHHVQEILPLLCGFYNFRMKPESKTFLFRGIHCSLKTIYPNLSTGDYNPIGISLNEDWLRTLRKLMSIVEVEAKEQAIQFQRPASCKNDLCLSVFVNISAMIVYLVNWSNNSPTEEETPESRKKVSKNADQLETILKSTMKDSTCINQIWLEIFTELTVTQSHLINPSNFVNILEAYHRSLSVFASWQNLKCLRVGITALLKLEQSVFPVGNTELAKWTEIVELLIADTSNNVDILREKHLLFQELIRANKLSSSECIALLNSMLSNNSMRRNESIATIREVMRYSDNCNLDKSSDLVRKLLNWLYQSSTKIDGKSLLLNLESMNEALIADTSALMIINFVDMYNWDTYADESHPDYGNETILLNYKYCRKYICIEEHGKELKKASGPQLKDKSSRCVIQSNYELLMRLLNYETSKEAKMSFINEDLARLVKMTLLLRKFFDYDIFNKTTYLSCPLVKRIGFFLDNIDFLLKSVDVPRIPKLELLEAIEALLEIFNTICLCTPFLEFLAKQNIDNVIAFVGSVLKSSELHKSEDSDKLSLVTLKLLATFCSSSIHSEKAFTHIKQQRLSIKENTSGILAIIKIFCQQEQNVEIAVWFVGKLRTICQLYYTNVTVTENIVDMIPDILRYVEPFRDELQQNLIIISSFLKVAFKKVYSTRIATKLIRSIRRIVKLCPNMVVLDDFASICFSSAKFLSSPNVAVSFAVVNTVASLMDAKWVLVNPSNMERYFQFCCTLYSQLNWNNLPMDTDDVKKNSIGVTIQLLTALYSFSSFHREHALIELGNYYAAQSLTESNFYQFGQIGAYYGCSISALSKPCSDALLNAWTENKYPIIRFPYFLCSEDSKNWFLSNLPNICFHQLKFAPKEGLEELQRLKYGNTKQQIWKALPFCYAYSLSLLSGNSQHPSTTYATEAKVLLRNLKDLGCNLGDNAFKIYWTTICYATEQLWDESHFMALFGINHFSTPQRLSISLLSYKHILRFYLQKCYNCPGTLTEYICMLIKLDPMILLTTLNAFKLASSDSVFIGDKLKAFYWFCSLAEIVIDSVSEGSAASDLSAAQTFFLRDILFFVLTTIGQANVETEILKAGLHFIHNVLEKNITAFTEIINKYLNDITCIVVSIAQDHGTSNVQDTAINLLELIICEHSMKFYGSIKLLEKFPDLDVFHNLLNVQKTLNKDREGELRWVVQDFLNSHTKGIVGPRLLKQCIAEKKGDFQDLSLEGLQSSNLLYDLLKRLIDIVRGSDPNLAMEAAKCLGEIGSVKITEISFYFESDTTFYNMESAYKDEMEFFAESFCRQLDKLLLKFDSASCCELRAVCRDLVNSKFGSKVLSSFPLLSVFFEQGRTCVLDGYATMAPFSFVEILKEHENLAYNKWVKAFSSKVFRQACWESFADLCEVNFSFSESSIIPMFKVLLANRRTHFDNIIAMLNHFFLQTFEAINGEAWKTSRNIYSDKRVIMYFLNICECIRIHNNWEVPVNILHVAKASTYCQAHFMGILYLEMWALEKKEKEKTSKNAEIIRNPVFQDIATQAFKSIDCTEAISGFLDPLTSRLEYLNLEGDWSQVLLEIDAANNLNKNLYVQNLKRNGLLMLSSSDKFSNKLDYECCWRLGQWDTPVEVNSKIASLNDLEFEFEKNHFNALKSIHNREEVNCLSAIDKARQAIISILKEISIECLQSIYKYLTRLHLLQQAEDFSQIQFASSQYPEDILKKWTLEQDLKYGNFNCTELVLSHQMALYKIAGIRAGRKINEYFKDKSAVGECILKIINECKNACNINLAIRNITLLRNIETSEQIKAKALIEDAEICWKTGKSRMAKEILHNVMLNKDFIYCLERIQAHRMYGELLLETNNETFDVVYEEFFLRSIELLNKYSEHREKILKSSSYDVHEFEAFDRESRKLSFETIAKYADKEYMQLDAYLNSETFRTKVQIMMKNKEEAHTLAKQTKDRDKSIGINVMLRNCGIDDKEIKLLEQKRSQNLCIAMENYIQFCKLDETITSPAIYRIIALWFANKHDLKLHEKIKEILNEIPSFKFLCVLNQMSARLSSKNPQFLQLLEELLVKCIKDHPHHTLHKILALVFAYADDPKNTSTSDRVNIAKAILNKARNKSNITCIKQMECMFIALIDFANKDAGKSTSLSLSDKIKKLRNLDSIHCPTMDLPISVNKEYTLTYVRKWEENVGLVGGINAPKKLMCVCSDGVARPQLLKGKDDLRQDAVMQQVLDMVNKLLMSDPETNDQKLLLRTYRVVPLSMRSGILEWCKNTVPLGLYLCGDKKTQGAHKQYRPNDFTVAKCRTLSMDALKKQNVEHRLQTYLAICENIKPVFHYFFFEKFLVPGIWFERRLAYTKSVATTSIVGYILGLGDRHVQNILIDELTAEVIHIDFGIAFEQGKIMPTPETVPFRLTRDIVAPMGFSEADGVFRKACEKTMKILRKNHVFLTTILEVLLYDPLYVWKWSSQKTLDGEKDGEDEGKNLTAQRALLRVQDKLEGKEEGKMDTPNVEVHVERLINEAMNVHNLCRLYPGWDPYL